MKFIRRFINQAGNVGYNTLVSVKIYNQRVDPDLVDPLQGLCYALPQHIQLETVGHFEDGGRLFFLVLGENSQSFTFFFAKIVTHRDKCCMRRGVGYVWGHMFF